MNARLRMVDAWGAEDRNGTPPERLRVTGAPARAIRRAQPHLGTLVEVECEGGWDLAGAVDAAFAAIAAVEALMSFHRPTSDVARINGAALGQPVEVAAETRAVLDYCRALSQASGGAFDCTIGATLVEHGLLPGMARSGRHCGGRWSDLELREDGTVRKHVDLLVDLGGVAKGYAVDRAVAALQARGVRAGAVSAGGDLRVFGPLARTAWLRTQAGFVDLGGLREVALATSARPLSALHTAGLAPGAIVDPQKRRVVDAAKGVSVVAPDCMSADALTKVALVAPPEVARVVLAQRRAVALDHAALLARCGERCSVVRNAHDALG